MVILPEEIWVIIYGYLHGLNTKMIHTELLENCSRHAIETLNDCNNIYVIGNEMIYHKSIHPIYNDRDFFKSRGYCSVKCQAMNWPHTCNFCYKCESDPDYCICDK
jgi:hypothetical protein